MLTIPILTEIVYAGDNVNSDPNWVDGGFTINTINLSAKTWTTTAGVATFGPSGTITKGSPVSQTWNTAAVTVFVMQELMLQQECLGTGNGLSPSQTAYHEAAITYLEEWITANVNQTGPNQPAEN